MCWCVFELKKRYLLTDERAQVIQLPYMEIVYSLSLSPSKRNAKIMWARQKADDERGEGEGQGERVAKKPGRSRRLKFPI